MPTLLERIGGPNAVSLPGWLLTLPGVIVVVPWAIPGSTDRGPAWLVLSLAGQLAVGVVLWLAWLTVLPSGPRPGRPFVALVVYALAGAVRGVVLGPIGQWLGFGDAEHSALRQLTPIPITVVVLSVTTVMVDSVRRHRAVMMELSRQIEQERFLAEESARLVRDYRSELVQQTRDVVTEQLDKAVHLGPDPVATAARVQQVSDEVVRPLSHELQERSHADAMVLAQVPTSGSVPRLPWRSYVLGTFTRRPYSPILTAVLVTVSALSQALHITGVRTGLLMLGMGALVMVALLWLARTVFMPRIRSWSVAMAVVLVSTSWVVTAVAVVEAMRWVATHAESPGLPTLLSEVNAPPLRGVVFLACMAAMVGLALAWSVIYHLAVEEQRLADAADRAAWTATKLRQSAWSEQRLLGRLIHRDLQARLVSLALQIQLDDGSGVEQAVRRAEEEIDALLLRVASPATWRQSMDELTTVWGYSLDLDVDIPDRLARGLDADPVAGQAVVEVAREAITNAVRHGAASAVAVRGDIDEATVTLVVLDDGRERGEPGQPGIGSRVMDEVCVEWELTATPSGHELRASIPCQVVYERA